MRSGKTDSANGKGERKWHNCKSNKVLWGFCLAEVMEFIVSWIFITVIQALYTKVIINYNNGFAGVNEHTKILMSDKNDRKQFCSFFFARILSLREQKLSESNFSFLEELCRPKIFAPPPLPFRFKNKKTLNDIHLIFLWSIFRKTKKNKFRSMCRYCDISSLLQAVFKTKKNSLNFKFLLKKKIFWSKENLIN